MLTPICPLTPAKILSSWLVRQLALSEATNVTEFGIKQLPEVTSAPENLEEKSPETLFSLHWYWIIGRYHGVGAKSARAVRTEQQRGQQCRSK